MKAFYYLLVFSTLALTPSCNKTAAPDDKAETADQRPLVKIAQVETRAIPQIQKYTATVEAEAVNNIAPAMPIRIKTICVEVGDEVQAGQQLVKMDEATLKQLQLQLTNKRVEFERSNELYKIGGVSKSEWDAVKMAYDVQKTAYEDLIKNTTLSSPINGIVTARNYDNGDLYSGAEPVLVVEQIAPVKLLINVSEQHYTQIKKGAEVDVQLEALGDETFKGQISLIYPTIDANTRTFPVEIKIRNRDRKIRPGMFARATLNFGDREHIVVPDLAIVKQKGSGDHYVYVYKDGKVTYNKVKLGRRLGDEYELLSGVPDGAQVVIAGQTRLADQIEVKVQ